MLHPSIACEGQSGKFRAWYAERYQEEERKILAKTEMKEAA